MVARSSRPSPLKSPTAHLAPSFQTPWVSQGTRVGNDKPFDATIPYDATFFELLDRFVQAEPWLTRDKVMIDTLKTIGIEKGKPFKPDAKTKSILDNAAKTDSARRSSRGRAGDCRYRRRRLRDWAPILPTRTNTASTAAG